MTLMIEHLYEPLRYQVHSYIRSIGTRGSRKKLNFLSFQSDFMITPCSTPKEKHISMNIRPEAEADKEVIYEIIHSAFNQAMEADLVDQLRDSGDSVFSLVAEEDGELVGHILFSRMQSPDGSLGMAPVSVLPDRQGSGIGSALICEGLKQATEAGWKSVFLLGEPAYYSRFGFSVDAALPFDTIYPAQYFMALELVAGGLPADGGVAVYAEPFLELG